MLKSVGAVLFGLALAVTNAYSQNTFPSTGNVGIGTTSPATSLNVVGDLGLDTSHYLRSTNGSNTDLNYLQLYDANGGMNFFTYYGIGNTGQGYFKFYTASATTPTLSINSSGSNLVSSPTSSLVVQSTPLGTSAGNATNLFSLQNGNGNGSQLNIFQMRNSNGTNWTSATTRIQQVTDVSTQAYIDFNPTGGTWGLAFGSGSTEYMRLLNGNVGIGTISPGSKLEVDGNFKLTSGSGASITFADGTVQSTAYTGVTCGGDYADSVDVSGERRQYEPGDVLVLSSDGEGDVAKSAAPYSTLVAGIYSTRPGTVGRRQTTDLKSATKEIPMAMVGIVPTKVSAENGPIRRGDLLVTSSREGYAMKGTDRSQMLGAVVGKAMGSLDSGRGVIEVLVTLQ